MSSIIRNSPGFYHHRKGGAVRTHIKDYPLLSNGLFVVGTSSNSCAYLNGRQLWKAEKGIVQMDKEGAYYVGAAEFVPDLQIYKYAPNQSSAIPELIIDVPLPDGSIEGFIINFAIDNRGYLICLARHSDGTYYGDRLYAFDPYGNKLWDKGEGALRGYAATAIGRGSYCFVVGLDENTNPAKLMVQKIAIKTGNVTESLFAAANNSLSELRQAVSLDLSNKYLYTFYQYLDSTNTNTVRIKKIRTFDLSLVDEYDIKMPGTTNLSFGPECSAIGYDGFIYVGGSEGRIYKISPKFTSEEITVNVEANECSKLSIDTYGSLYVQFSNASSGTVVNKYNPDHSLAFSLTNGGSFKNISAHPGKVSIFPHPPVNTFKPQVPTTLTTEIGKGFIKASCDPAEFNYLYGYEWFLNGNLVSRTLTPQYKFKDIVNGETYSIGVRVKDKFKQVSGVNERQVTAIPPYKFYRLSILSTNLNGDYAGTIELVLRESKGGENAAIKIGGIASTNYLDPNYPPENAFNGNLQEGDGFISSAQPVFPVYLQFEFNKEASIIEYGVASYPFSGAIEHSSRSWQLLASNDGAEWTVLDEQSGQGGWAVGEVRYFEI